MKKFGLWAFFALLLFIVQVTVLPFFPLHGVTGDLLLLLAASYGFLKGRRLGVLAGFFLGLCHDLATGTFFGIHTFVDMTVGLCCGKFSDQVFKDQFFLPLTASVFATSVAYFVPLAFVFMMGYEFDAAAHMRNNLPAMLILEFLLACPVHKLTLKADAYIREQTR